MPRVTPIEAESASTEIQPLVQRICRERGSLLMLYKVLLNSSSVAQGWLTFLSAIRQECDLSPKLRELVILRVAVLNQAPYEFTAHVPYALDAGVPEEWIEVLKGGATPDDASELERAVLTYADRMTRDIRVPESDFAAIRRQLNDQHIVELTATIAAYNMVSRFLIALSIHEEH